MVSMFATLICDSSCVFIHCSPAPVYLRILRRYTNPILLFIIIVIIIIIIIINNITYSEAVMCSNVP